MKTDFWALTDVGRVRPNNEDCFTVCAELGLFIVADGMGGHHGGAVASEFACNGVANYIWERKALLDDLVAEPTPLARRKVLRLLNEAIRFANDQIAERAEFEPKLEGMGTTVVVALTAGDRLFLAHIGDSRAYLIRNHDVLTLTEDHSLVFELIRQGRLTRQAAARFPMKNVVTRALGVRGVVEADVLEMPLLPGDRIIICSDGLHSYLDDDLLNKIITDQNLQNTVERLLKFALNSGGSDNITVLGIDVSAISADADTVNLKNNRIRAIPLFSDLEFSEFLRLISACEHRLLNPGDELFTVGEIADGMYAIVSGAVEIRNGDKPGQRFGTGTYFGELSLFEERPRLVSAVAVERTELFVLTKKLFDSIANQYPAVSTKLLRQLVLILAKRLRDAYDERVILKDMLEVQAKEAPVIISSEMLEEDDDDDDD